MGSVIETGHDHHKAYDANNDALDEIDLAQVKETMGTRLLRPMEGKRSRLTHHTAISQYRAKVIPGTTGLDPDAWQDIYGVFSDESSYTYAMKVPDAQGTHPSNGVLNDASNDLV
ncbi:hypothetical protein H4R35_007188 [Dimargaris xerosporica]|nr:hypothetical protein H4R35_007188 [Dimargaris xerosporica]